MDTHFEVRLFLCFKASHLKSVQRKSADLKFNRRKRDAVFPTRPPGSSVLFFGIEPISKRLALLKLPRITMSIEKQYGGKLMKNLIGIFLIAAIAAVGLYGLHTYNQKKEREAQLEIARLEQQKLEEERRREEALKKAEAEKRRLAEEQQRREEALKKAEAEKRRLAEEQQRREEALKKAEAEKRRLAEEQQRREEALKKAEQAKCFQANLAIAKKALRRINVRRYNTPVKELVKFQQYIELLNPPEDILSLAQDLPKIAAAIRMPSNQTALSQLPKDCFRMPRCTTCGGFGRETRMDSHKMTSVVCDSCDGTGILQKKEPRVAHGGISPKVYYVKMSAGTVFDLQSAQQAFKNRTEQLSGWLDMQ
ncbi:hypothetical protein [uncultured Victivallis sp.]|nr:hypothetical protein [uncultured Victivallis sp.]